MRCPNGKGFHFRYRRAVKGNQYGRQEEIYECEDCSAVRMRSNARKRQESHSANQCGTDAMHREVMENLGSIQERC